MTKKKLQNRALGKRYTVHGTGEKVLVFIHYFGGDAGSWGWLIKRLSKKYTCIALNLPGFGGTDALREPSIYGFATYINDMVTELDLKEYIICGHSMGAKLVLYAMQLMKGVKPKKLVLIAPSPPTVEAMSLSEKKRMLRHPNADEAENTVISATVKPISKKRMQYAIASQLRAETETWKWWLTDGMNNNIADRISGSAVPTYIICSKDDPVIPLESIYAEVMPYVHKAKLVQLSKIGHLIPIEAPRKLARLLRKMV